MPTIRRRLLHRIAYVRRNRCSALLAALCLLILVNPLFVGSRVGATSLTFGLYAVLMLAVWALRVGRRMLWAAALLAFVAFDAGLLDRLGGQPTRPLMLAGTALFTAVVTVALLRYVLDRRPIKTDKIFGAVAAYVLIAFTFTSLFGLLQLVEPGAFRDATRSGSDTSLDWPALMYFSFTVLTSTGFGEIIPMSNVARSLIVIEQVLGVMYVAFLVARLANLYGRTAR
jgi:hypothetical protein